jgi:predicted MPP superfamily phosphohydrolase
MHRRRFLAAAGAAAGAALAGDVYLVEPSRIQLTRHDLPLPRLPPGLDGLRIAQVSDLHLPACRQTAERVVKLLAAERPEIVLHTGDALEVPGGAGALAELGAAMRGTVATAAVLGNWEHRDPQTVAAAERAWERAGVPLLTNAHATVRVGGAALALVGLADLLLARPDVEVARRGIPDGAVELWFGHEPELADRMPAGVLRPAILLCGHTHGGQIRLPGLRAFTPVGSGRYVAGMYTDAAVPLYVSRGIGTAEIRARFRCRPELPIFRLVAA